MLSWFWLLSARIQWLVSRADKKLHDTCCVTTCAEGLCSLMSLSTPLLPKFFMFGLFLYFERKRGPKHKEVDVQGSLGGVWEGLSGEILYVYALFRGLTNAP